jgi:hypothetical protein
MKPTPESACFAVRTRTNGVATLAGRHHADGVPSPAFIRKVYAICAGTTDEVPEAQGC